MNEPKTSQFVNAGIENNRNNITNNNNSGKVNSNNNNNNSNLGNNMTLNEAKEKSGEAQGEKDSKLIKNFEEAKINNS